MWPIKYLFYRLYGWQVSCWNDNKVSINALVLLVVLLWMNLVTLIGITESVLGVSFLLARFPEKLSHVGTLFFMLLIAAPLYFTFVYRRRYEGIVREFESESPRQRRSRGLGVCLYVVLSLLLLFGVALLHGKLVG